MPLINFRNILSCSSEDRIHCAENLLKPEQYKKWLSSKGSEERITCILELEKSSSISSVDIGNDGSAFIELFVSRSSSSKVDDWTVLLPATLLMTPSESRSNTNRNQVKLLKSSDLNKTCLNEKWDRLKIVCEQKFNRLNSFGLCFIKLYSPSTLSDETNQSESLNKSLTMMDNNNNDDDDETSKEQSKIGSFFAKKQAEKKLKISEPSASDQIRALSNVADELLSKKPMDDNEIQTLLKKDVKNTPNRLSKRRISSDKSDSSINENETKRSKTTDQSQLMKNVIFVLSGFKNPLRTELRNKATKMGAIYNDDWDRTCTHLICAFSNTPKFAQVKQTGKGLIVNKEWILDCYKQNQLLSEKNYELKGSNNNIIKKDTPNRTSEIKTRNSNNNDKAENEKSLVSKDITMKSPMKTKVLTFDDDDDDEPIRPTNSKRKTPTKKAIKTFDDDDDEEEPIISKDVTKKPTTSADKEDVYDAETDEDEPKIVDKLSELPDFFHGKHFYIYDNDFNDDTMHDIRRVIYAYDGILGKQITSDVKYIITNRTWNHDFEKIAKTNPEMKFLSIDWLQKCHDENKLVPYQSFLILP
ncbi:unnamed protein product [Adineta steineri]|uniref:BRCT domain-containing protein n=1 Tax=Adineta steineri TaxID=433720 RepID=A0A818ZQY5_9BILA|nr:unnamed protein product [Adineta steineri]CAF3773072.1 unnamed protein product [Adineta steineri]